ncbi:hypothetical protein [Engelhardtia mirabilis]|uniref:hypothetical protein n=1 Tax=Engelhardtia mirabilis TaxID=2528011 RepID=UPI00119CC253
MLAALAVALAALLLGLRARYAFDSIPGTQRTFEVALWGKPLASLAGDALVAMLDRVGSLLRGLWAVLAAVAGLVLARALAPRLQLRGASRAGLALGLAALGFFALDPGLLEFVAGRSFVGAPHYLEVEDALRGLALLALVLSAIALEPMSLRHGPGRAVTPAAAGSPWPSVIAAGLVAAVGAYLWSSVFLDGLPLTNDGWSYRYQAQVFELGRASLPGGAWTDFFPARQVWVGERVFSKYPPGHALVLAAGGALGSPLLFVRLGWLLGPALVFLLARRLGVRRPVLAAWLFALAPTPLVLGGLWLSHGTSLPTGLAFLVAVVLALDADERADRRRTVAWSLAAGLALGLCALARPGTAVALALPPLVAICARPRRLVAAGLPTALGALPWLLALLFYNRATTGEALLNGYTLYAREISPDDRWGLVNANLAWGNTSLGLSRLTLWLHGFGASAGLALIGAWLVPRRRWLVIGVPLALAAFYALLSFHGLPWAGPLYWVEAFPLLACASAQGIDRIERFAGPAVGRVVLVAAAAGALLLATSHGLVARAEADLRRAPQIAAAAAGVERGVVFVRLADEPSRKRAFLAPPAQLALSSAIPALIFAADRGAANRELLRVLGDPPAYLFDPRDGSFTSRER